MFSRRSVVSLGVFVAFMLSLLGVAYLKMSALSEEEFLQLSTEQQYEILIENGMEPYPGQEKEYHIKILEIVADAVITGKYDASYSMWGWHVPGVIQARIGKTLYEMGYPKVIKPRAPSYYTAEEQERYYEQK